MTTRASDRQIPDPRTPGKSESWRAHPIQAAKAGARASVMLALQSLANGAAIFQTLRGRLSLMLAVMILLFLARAVIILVLVGQQRSDGKVINLAGLQRTLLQRTYAQAFRIAAGYDEDRDQLKATAAQFDARLTALLEGDPRSGIPRAKAARAQLLHVQSDWEPYYERLRAVVTLPRESAQLHSALAFVALRHEDLIDDMDEAVAFYEADFADKVATLERLTILLAIGGAVVAAAAWWLVLDRFARPLSVLAQGAARWGQGNLKHRVRITSKDEVGLLAREFNTMAGQLQQALAVLKRRHDVILDSAGEGIYGVDLDGNATFVNPAAASMLGWTPNELNGMFLHDAFHHSKPDGTPYAAADCPIHRTIGNANDGPYRRDNDVFWRKDGTSFPVEYVCAPIREEQGSVAGAVVTFRDITERKKAEADLQRAAELLMVRSSELENKTSELERSNAELEQFAYAASHDLQEPLRMVASFTQLLARRYKGKLDADADEFIHFAADGAVRMQALIADLLAYSRVNMRGKPLEYVDLNEVFQQVCQSLAHAIEESKAAVDSDQLPSVVGDKTQLSQLMQNLISNSIKFRGKTSPSVHVSAKQDHGHWLISIVDNGIGIAPDYQSRIFNLFERLHSAREYPGTGIGLAICKKVVQQHGGTIWVDSKPGEGSTFSFVLPIGEG